MTRFPTQERILPGRKPCLSGLLLSGILSAAVAHADALITITGLPPYGGDGFLQGIVTGVDTSQYKVAPFIHIEGGGWWTKPTFGAPTVPIAANGFFSADVVGGGLDDRATIYCAHVVPVDATVPLAAGEGRVPAGIDAISVAHQCTERYVRTISFAGYQWGIKEAPLPVGPGSNYFSDRSDDVFVDDDGRLHLTLRRHDGSWFSTETILTESLGFGTYHFVTETDVDGLDPNVVFGAFTWDAYGDAEGPTGSNNREIDSEDSRWRNAADPAGSQWAIAPYWPPSTVHRYALPDLGQPPYLSRFIDWSADQLVFTALAGQHTPCSGNTTVIDTYTYTHSPGLSQHVPDEGRERFRFNLWLNDNSGPADGQEVEVIVSDFAFYPPGDIDCDGIAQAIDNCSLLANPQQRDTDGDGFGNRCDADLDNDCFVNFSDLDIFRLAFFTADADADLDGSGQVDFGDLSIVRMSFFETPGPSAVATCP